VAPLPGGAQVLGAAALAEGFEDGGDGGGALGGEVAADPPGAVEGGLQVKVPVGEPTAAGVVVGVRLLRPPGLVGGLGLQRLATGGAVEGGRGRGVQVRAEGASHAERVRHAGEAAARGGQGASRPVWRAHHGSTPLHGDAPEGRVSGSAVVGVCWAATADTSATTYSRGLPASPTDYPFEYGSQMEIS
jgi:hypothetical protein